MSDPLDGLSDEERERAEKSEMPDWTGPMLAKLTHDPFSDDGWMYERKLDGERVVCFVGPAGGVRLMSRNREMLNDSYPEVERALEGQAPRGCVLDGEVVAFGPDGTSDFQRLQPRMQAGSREEAESEAVGVFYYLFDCMYLHGHDVTGCSLRGRKGLLRRALDWSDPLRLTPHRNGSGMELYREACRKGWEGVIAKRAASTYVSGRSGDWLKFKCVHRQELVIGGYTEPRGERTGFGALLLGFYEGGELVYAGKVGTGFDEETLEMLSGRLEEMERGTPPFRRDPEEEGAHYVTPRLVCEVAFTEWTSDSMLRHPAYKGLRRDKEPEDVTREETRPKAESPAGEGEVRR